MKTKITLLAIAMIFATQLFSLTPPATIKTRVAPQHQSMFKDRLKDSSPLKENLRLKMNQKFFMDMDVYLEHSADTLHTFNWSDYAMDFEHETTEVFTYEDGRIKELIIYVSFNNELFRNSREVYTWLPNGNLDQTIRYFWDMQSETWNYLQKENYFYDEKDDIILEVHSGWEYELNSWVDYFQFRIDRQRDDSGNLLLEEAWFSSLFIGKIWLPSYKNEYEYDEKDRLYSAVYSYPWDGAFVKSNKEVYFYSDYRNEFTSVLLYNYSDDEWIPSFKFTDIEWYDFDNFKLQSITSWLTEDDFDWDKKDEVDWIPFIKESFEYDNPAGKLTRYQQEMYFWGSWYEIAQVLRKYNEYNFLTRLDVQYHDMTSWETELAIAVDGEFNSKGQPVNLRVSYFDAWEGDEWINLQWLLFGYKTDVPTSLPAIKPSDFVKVYPNPVTSHIFLASEQITENMEISIFNINGQLVQCMLVPAFGGQTRLDISHLPAGIYMLNIQSGTQRQVSKIMKK